MSSWAQISAKPAVPVEVKAAEAAIITPAKSTGIVVPMSTKQLRTSPDGVGIACLDAGAYIRMRAPKLHLFSPESVLREVRDQKARDNLSFINTVAISNIRTETGTPADYAYVKQFAKLTGDLAVLSGPDLDVAALAVKLTREFMGSGRLRTGLQSCGVSLKYPKMKDSSENHARENIERRDSSEAQYSTDESDDSDIGHVDFEDSESVDCQEKTQGPTKKLGEFGGGWVTPDNYDSIGRGADNIGGSSDQEVEGVTNVYCITTDYSLQNLLLSMGIQLKTIDGFAIKKLQIWGRICRACQSLILDPSRNFCRACGNYRMRKVPIERNSDGTVTVKDNRWYINKRGMNTSLPNPKGGKAGKFKKEIILCEDQLKTHTMKWQNKKRTKDHQRALEADTPFGLENSRRLPQTIEIGLGSGNPNSKLFNKRRK